MSGLIGKQHKTTLCLLGFRLGTLGVSSSESLRRDVHFFGFLNMGRGPFAEIDTTLAHGMQSFHWKICKGWLLHHYVGNKKWNFSSWWFQPIWNICSSNWIIPPISGWTSNISKTTIQFCLVRIRDTKVIGINRVIILPTQTMHYLREIPQNYPYICIFSFSPNG